MFGLFFKKKKGQEADPVIDCRINPKWKVCDKLISDGTNCPIIIREFYDRKTGKQLRRREKWQRYYSDEWWQILIECETFKYDIDARLARSHVRYFSYGTSAAVTCGRNTYALNDNGDILESGDDAWGDNSKPLTKCPLPKKVDSTVVDAPIDPDWIINISADDSLKDVSYIDPATSKVRRLEQWNRFREYGIWYEQLGQVFLYEYQDGVVKTKNRNFADWGKLNEREDPDDVGYMD